MSNAEQLERACSGELATLMWFGNAFLWISLVSAVVVTALAVVERLVALRKAPTMDEAGGGGVSTLLDSVKGLVTALGQAPAWFAIFLASILLLWSAPTFFGAKCVLMPATTGDQPAPHDPAHAKGNTVKPASD